MVSPDGPDDSGTDLVLERKPKLAHARRHRVVFHNDDFTTKAFVAHVLQSFFHMDETAAQTLMLAIHRHGSGVAGVYTRDIAETKVVLVTDYARENEMPLKVSAEPDDDGET